jgi:peptidyl-dipeptidase A
MFETSDEFYQSLGLPENSMSYDEKVAMIEKPADGRVVVCHASAWDFCDRRDFRLAQTMAYFIWTMIQP